MRNYIPYCLTLTDIEWIYAAYSEEGADDLEELPFHNLYREDLEGILTLPQRGVGDIQFYSTLPEQGAILFYEVIKRHPFFDGNKRMACLILFTFLYLNDVWIHISNEQLYTLAHTVACSDPKERDRQLTEIQQLIEQYETPLEGKEGSRFMGLDIGRLLNTLNPFSR